MSATGMATGSAHAQKHTEELSMPRTTGNQDLGTSTRPRLESWKEVAAYLKRGVRTVRRWERQERLPVHRHHHGRQGTVFAFPDEIEKWLQSRSVKGNAGRSSQDHERLPSAGRGIESAEREAQVQPAVIAILPLRNLGGPEQERFADGLTEELISEIGHCCPSQLRVIAFTSAVQYKQSPKTVQQIGRELGANYILEGSIQSYGRRVRLTARLIAARDQAHIWGDTYEVQLPPIFSLQQSLAQEVADAVSIKFHATPESRRRRATFSNVAAYNAYLEAKSHFLPTQADTMKSIEHLNLAIEREPKFAPSYAELALTYFRRILWDYPPIVMFKRIEENAAKALKLNSKLAHAHSMLAAFHLFWAWDWSKAERESRRAVELNPSDAWGTVIRASYHLVVGEREEAIKELNRFPEPDAQACLWLAQLACPVGCYDLAVQRIGKLLRLDPSSALVHLVLGLNLVHMGEYALAINHAETARQLGADSISLLSKACSIYALAGERQSAESLFEELLAAQERQYTRYMFLAEAAASMGKDQQTFEWLDKAYDQRDPLLVFLNVDPRFDSISGLPRYRSLIRRIGLPTQGLIRRRESA